MSRIDRQSRRHAGCSVESMARWVLVCVACSVGCYRSHEVVEDTPRFDATLDATLDAAVDAVRVDAVGVAPDTPNAIFPWNGYLTGSIHVPTDAPVHPLRPRFMWEPVGGADTYQLELTDECSTDFRACAFRSAIREEVRDTRVRARMLPVSTRPPVGRRYFWRLRACNSSGCSSWTEVRYLDVGRQASDFDGDGYADLVASGEGGAAIHAGGPAGVRGLPTIEITYDGADARGPVMWSSASADIDADGFADLVVGAVGRVPPSLGNTVLIFAGGVDGLAPEPSRIFESDEFVYGAQVANVGDVDGDGFADVLIVALDPSIGTQAAHLHFGSADGIAAAPRVLEMEGFAFRGTVDGVGDTNGDGYADFVLGRDLLLGGRARSLESPVTLVDLTERRPRFGTVVGAAGDVNADGYADIAQAAPYTAQPAMDPGSVAIHFGGPSGPSSAVDRLIRSPLSLDDTISGTFGTVVQSADLDADGDADLVVGAPQYSTAERGFGIVYIYESAERGPSMRPIRALENPAPDRGELGRAIALCDTDGNGVPELMLGAPFQGQGRVLVYTDQHAASPSAILESSSAGRRFGQALRCE